MLEAVLAVDLGGTNLRLAAVNREGEILARQSDPTPRGASREEFAEGMAAALLALAQTCPGVRMTAVGVGVPGRVLPGEGHVVFAPNLQQLNDFDLGPALARRLPWPVGLENDANLFTLGEFWLGAGVGAESLLGITLGTGVGGGLILAGRLWPGSAGTAAEIGHMTIEPEGLQCHCGNHGCLETLASASWTTRWVKERLAGGAASQLSHLWATAPADLDARAIFAAAQQGDGLAREAMQRAGRALGIALANVIQLLGLSHVVVGGNFARAWDELYPPVAETLQQRLRLFPVELVRVVPAALGDNAGLLGAARLAWGLGGVGPGVIAPIGASAACQGGISGALDFFPGPPKDDD